MNEYRITIVVKTDSSTPPQVDVTHYFRNAQVEIRTPSGSGNINVTIDPVEQIIIPGEPLPEEV